MYCIICGKEIDEETGKQYCYDCEQRWLKSQDEDVPSYIVYTKGEKDEKNIGNV